jgi:HAD superfamily hydrolase (TIGR01509 family)
MIQTIVFDLAETLIGGLLSIDSPSTGLAKMPPQQAYATFGGPRLHELMTGQISVDDYLIPILAEQEWEIPLEVLKEVIRRTFRRQMPGMAALVEQLAEHYDLALLSDHAGEWVKEIRLMHPFLERFKYQFFSYQLKSTKSEPDTFRRVLEKIGRQPAECVFIDDNPKNVAVACSIGMVGIVFMNVEELRNELEGLGIKADR